MTRPITRREAVERQDAARGGHFPVLFMAAVLGVLLTLWLIAIFGEYDPLENATYSLAVPGHPDCPTRLC